MNGFGFFRKRCVTELDLFLPTEIGQLARGFAERKSMVINKSYWHKLFYVFHPFGLLAEAILFKMGKTKFHSKYLVTTFLLVGGTPGTFLSRFLGIKKQNLELLSRPSVIQVGNSFSKTDLRDRGYSLVPTALDPKHVDKILDLSFSLKGSNRGMDSGKGFQDGIYFDRENPKTVRFDYHPNDVIADPTIQKIVSDPKILEIAQDYLGTLPVLDFVAMWWHTKSSNPDKEAAQYFHFDMDRLRWVKFFFYITDVGPDNGPHVFVPTSHSDSGLPFALRKNGYTRLDDEQVRKHFKEESWRTFVGPKGSMIVEDTRGLHKGKHVGTGDRLIFQIQFTSALFGTDISNLEINQNDIGLDLRNSMQNFPDIYRNVVVQK